MVAEIDELLAAAGRQAGLEVHPARLMREGSHALFQVPNGIVARIGPPGSGTRAGHELRVAAWLHDSGVPVVEPIVGVDQPTMVGDRPVTWWVELPRHRHATPAELGRALRKLHRLPRPTTLELRPLNPFNGFDERIHRSGWPVEGDRVWLAQQLAELKGRWDDLAVHGDASVIHGDAWQGNVAVADGGEPTLVDLEHVSLGIREWDLAPLAVDYTDFRRVSQDEYGEFVEAYGGYDVTTWGGYRTVADIQELRWVCFSLGRAAVDSRAAAEARHRIACLRGEIPRPWTWTAL